ncbi:hypothetical protein [Amycolatopsis vancoresmycina]|uniref:Uncharacterized protein n=1 Tax=Amycolatopsis vancoresmycina DSM 44592 TaxID=1292037 RepID=R1G4A1_9PSEU|nr:hypothetical protein [Amycolatopsis vancoresmycina]EOD66277.1 hypothetical protein H480_22342 [Amycolatopsis vancoresmycina DSM 44592]
MDGRGYLEKLISDGLGAGRGQPPAGRLSGFDRREIRGVAIGLVAAGALGQEEADRILADLDVTLQRSGRLNVVHAEASASATFAPVARHAGTERPEWRQAIEEPPRPVLRQVVSLAGRTLEAGELTADLVSLEVWSAFVVLTMAQEGFDPRRMRERFALRTRWRAWDDAGTQYRAGGGGGSGSHGLLVERRTFEPGPPAEARLLTVAVESADGEATVPIPLPADPPG